MATNRRRLLTLFYLSSVPLAIVPIVEAQFYIGEYKTVAPLKSDRSDVQHPFRLNVDDDRENDVDTVGSTGQGRSANNRQGLIFGTFNPLTPGGTIYLAFIFLIPLTVGSVLGRRRIGSPVEGFVQRLVEHLEGQEHDPSLYNEMGYLDGNRLVKRAWREMRRQWMRPWRALRSRVKTKWKKNAKSNKPKSLLARWSSLKTRRV